jgi:phospholipid-translocating ATPase
MFPLACASKKLNQAESNYPTIERECLAVKWGIEKFALYLHGTEFVVQTDQAPLTALDRLKSASGRCTKWALQLQPFKFRVEAIPGRDNQAADFLSRLKTD